MSDLLVLLNGDRASLEKVMRQWADLRSWAKGLALEDRWEKAEIEIRRSNAYRFMKGKHKRELAELVKLVAANGGRVALVHLHGSEKSVEPLDDWAMKVLSGREQEKA